MNSEHNLEKDNALGRALRQWTIEAPLPVRFQEQVWQRIARAESHSEPIAWTTLLNWIQAIVPRPRFAYSYLAILLVTGVAAGSVAAQIKTHRVESDLSARYVHSIDPYLTENARP